MEEIQCWHCGDFFPKSPRHKEQFYCMKPECRKAKKAAWKRKKMRGKADTRGDPSLIAKVDASIPNKIRVVGEFYMVPVIAKVDALKVYIHEIPAPYQ